MYSFSLFVVSGWRGKVQGEAPGFDLHCHHDHQCARCAGHASVLRRNPLLWLRLRSLNCCELFSYSSHTSDEDRGADLVNKTNTYSFFQGSEIFTVYAKDGDQGNPNPIHYSIMNGKNNTLEKRSSLIFSVFLSDTLLTRCLLSPFRQ